MARPFDMAPTRIPLREEHGLGDALREFYMRSHRVMDRMMSARGASLARAKLLMFVDGDAPVRSADIIRAFGFAPRTVTEAVDGLERDGLIERVPDPADRRVKLLRVTEAGQAVIAATEPIKQAMTERLFSALTSAERAALAGYTGKLIERLAAIESDFANGQTNVGTGPAD